jgi:hypothetical protein
MARLVAQFYQDVHETVTRTLNWSDDLNGSTISTVTWTVPTGLTSVSETNTATTATIRMSASATGTYTVLCTITTAAAETLQEAVKVAVTD